MRGLRRQAVGAGAAALAATALIAAAGCGADEGATASAAPPELLGERPGKLTCTDWQQGTDPERLGTIEQLTMLAGANGNPQDVGPNRTLGDEEAYETLESTCSHEATRGFLLYEIYNRAAAFSLDGL